MTLKIMQGAHSGDDRGKRAGNLRVRGVCIVILSVHEVSVNRSMESFRDLCRRAAELDDHSTAADAVYAEPVRHKPSCRLLAVRLGGAEAIGELLGGEPSVVAGRSFVLLIGNPLSQVGFCRGMAFQN